MKHRILMFGTYPIYPAIHGGQKRVAAIIDKYRELGHEVKYVSVCTPGYSQYSDSDFLVSSETMRSLADLPSLAFTEITVCKESVNDLTIVNKIRSIILTFNPTIVSYEQGYVYAFIKNFKDMLGLLDLKIIFSSQNVEWVMKKEIALASGCNEKKIQPYVEDIKKLEKELLEKADYSLAVTKADADSFNQLTDNAKLLIVPNGIKSLSPDENSIELWRNFFDEHQIRHKIIFIASDHPPNLQGLRTFIDGVGFLHYRDRIIVAGGICNSLKQMFHNTSDLQVATLKNRMILAGTLSEKLLQGLIATANAIILPIMVGGGSNLKTAEAICAEKPIIASTCAFRGFEQFLKFPNIYIADIANDFQDKILEAIHMPYIERNPAQKKLALEVLWDMCLKPLEVIFEESKFNA
ncbi:hypothetical protein BGI37_08005 [Snodgrassella alvi]|jgi:glycosyltransferase involved in cell wall biosynthesis|nr:hypothetical protein BGI37_08005 [Snodgrassella alvi]